MPRRYAGLALVVAVCWAVNFVVIDIGLESFPPLLFAALRFALIALPAVFFVRRPDVRWTVVVAVGLFICVGQFGLLFVAMSIGAGGLASGSRRPASVHDPVCCRCARRRESAPGRAGVAVADLVVIAAVAPTASLSSSRPGLAGAWRRGAPGTSSRSRARSAVLCWSGRVWCAVPLLDGCR